MACLSDRATWAKLVHLLIVIVKETAQMYQVCLSQDGKISPVVGRKVTLIKTGMAVSQTQANRSVLTTKEQTKLK